MKPNRRLLQSIKVLLVLAILVGCQFLPEKTTIPDTTETPWAELALPETGSDFVLCQENKPLVHLTFDQISSIAQLNAILELLDSRQIKATFFLSGQNLAEEPDIVDLIHSHGHTLGNYTLNMSEYLDVLDQDEIAKQLYKPSIAIQRLSGTLPEVARIPHSQYPEIVLRTAKAVGIEHILPAGLEIKSSYLQSNETIALILAQIKQGTILSFDLTEDLDIAAALPTLLDAIMAKQIPIVGYAELLLLEHTSFATTYQAYIEKSVDYGDLEAAIVNLAKQENTVFSYAYTTKKTVALTFDGLGNATLVHDILAALARNHITATFFLSGNKVKQNPELAQAIVDAGHEIENNTNHEIDITTATDDAVQTEIAESAEILSSILGVDTTFVRARSGKVSTGLIKSAAATNHIVTTYSKNPQDRDMKSKQEILTYLAKRITRGEIINLYADTNPAVVAVIDELAALVYDIGYSFVSLKELYDNQYPRLSLDQIPGSSLIKTNPNVTNSSGSLHYQVDTTKKVVFLTFDDWGTDKVVTKILDTLAKNNIKASFFLRANGVEDNPNLAKAIADAGHDVSSHTYAHKNVTTMSSNALQADLVKAHRAITLAIQRKPQMYFRPPQLDVTDATAQVIYATGYKHIISSYLSTHDWDPSKSKSDILQEVEENAAPGSIIVLHLLDNASGWIILPDLIAQLKRDGYGFAKLSDYIPS